MKSYGMSLFIAMVLMTPCAFSMEKKSLFKRSLAVGATIGTAALTCAHYGCAFAPTGFPAAKSTLLWSELHGDIDKYGEPTEDAKQFIREQLAIQNIANPEGVRIKRFLLPKGDAGIGGSSSTDNTVFVHSYLDQNTKEVTSKLEGVLEKNRTRKNYYTKKQRNKELAEQKFIYRHEANHVYYCDTKQKLALGLAIPLCTEGLYYFCKKPFKPTRRWIRNLLALPLGVAKGYGNLMLLMGCQRYIEQRADDNVVVDNPKILQAAIHHFKRDQKKYEEAMAPSIFLANKKEKKAIKESIQKAITSPFDSHPSCYLRKERFKERLHEAKKINKHKEHNN